MGNGTSIEMEGVKLQSQGEQDLWSVFLDRQEEGNDGGVSVFTRTPAEGTLADFCCTAIEVSNEIFYDTR